MSGHGSKRFGHRVTNLQPTGISSRLGTEPVKAWRLEVDLSSSSKGQKLLNEWLRGGP